MRTKLITLLLSALLVPAAFADFELKDTPGKHLDILQDGKLVGRYMYALDKSTKETLHDTYKPYLHVFDAEGKNSITKGPGGQFTHHRGIFIGWNKIGHGGKNYDRWHMSGGQIIHQKFLEQKADANQATITSLTHWNDAAEKPIVEETRTMTFRKAPAGGRVLIDCTFTLKAVNGEVELGGDPEHAGVQYRPADEVLSKETVYVFPREKADATKDFDYPWVGETYTLAGKRHSVVHMNHPANPKQTKYSAYRDYGRFGAFFVTKIPANQSLTIQYRFLVADGELPATELIQKTWDQFAGVAAPSPAPALTIKKMAAPKPAK